jgi:hypothetical protein
MWHHLRHLFGGAPLALLALSCAVWGRAKTLNGWLAWSEGRVFLRKIAATRRHHASPATIHMDSGPATVVFQLRKKRRRAVVEADTARRNAICLYLISQNCLTATWLCGVAEKVKSWAPKLPIPYNPFHRLHIEEMPEGSLLNHQVHKEMRLTYVNNLKDGAWNFCVLVQPRSWRSSFQVRFPFQVRSVQLPHINALRHSL